MTDLAKSRKHLMLVPILPVLVPVAVFAGVIMTLIKCLLLPAKGFKYLPIGFLGLFQILVSIPLFICAMGIQVLEFGCWALGLERWKNECHAIYDSFMHWTGKMGQGFLWIVTMGCPAFYSGNWGRWSND